MRRLLLTATAVALCLAAPFAALRAADTADPVVAKVDGNEIHRSEIQATFDSLPDQYKQMPMEMLYEPLLQRVIDTRLLADEAQSRGLADDAAVKAAIARLTRTGMIEQMNADYIRTARARGVPEYRVVLKHALKNAAIPIVTIVGIELGTLLGGSVITETIFAWPGVGRLSVQAIYNRDYPVVQAAVFLLATTFVLVNLVVDFFYTYLDPRIRLR